METAYVGYPLVKISNAYQRLAELKPLGKPLKDATNKGNGYEKRLTKLTARLNLPTITDKIYLTDKKGHYLGEVETKVKGLVRRERINPKGSTFAFALIGQIPESGKYPRKRITVTTSTVKVKRASKIGVQKSEKVETLMAKQPLLIGGRLTLNSGSLPKWFR